MTGARAMLAGAGAASADVAAVGVSSRVTDDVGGPNGLPTSVTARMRMIAPVVPAAICMPFFDRCNGAIAATSARGAAAAAAPTFAATTDSTEGPAGFVDGASSECGALASIQ